MRKTKHIFRPDLHDVNIVSEDGRTISAHKCILTSRLEYFRSMFMAGWTEVKSTIVLSLILKEKQIDLESNEF